MGVGNRSLIVKKAGGNASKSTGKGRMRLRCAILFLMLLAGTEYFPAVAATVTYQSNVKPLLSRYCYNCHGEKKKGDLDLRIFMDETAAKGNAAVFEKVLDKIESQDMPPEGKPQPTKAERALITRWIETEVLGCDCNHPDPGRVTIRRLNRAEYNNTIWDLMGVNYQPADDFPLDDVGYGFDNIGDVLSLSPMLMEKYVAAAGKALDLAMATGPFTNGLHKHFTGEMLKSTGEGGKYGRASQVLATKGELYRTVVIPTAGEYVLRVKAFGQQAGKESVRLEIRIDNHAVKTVIVTAVEDYPEIYEARVKLQPGEKRLSVAFMNDYFNPDDPDPKNRARNLVVNYLAIAGPMEANEMPEPYRRIFIRQPTAGTTNEAARAIINEFRAEGLPAPGDGERTGAVDGDFPDGAKRQRRLCGRGTPRATGSAGITEFSVPRGIAGRAGQPAFNASGGRLRAGIAAFLFPVEQHAGRGVVYFGGEGQVAAGTGEPGKADA